MAKSNPSISLLPGEKVIFKANPHWLFIVFPEIGLFIFWLLYLFYACPFSGQINFPNLEDFCYLTSSLATLFLTLILYLDWRFNRLWLTNLRLVKERGIIGKRFMTLSLDKIQDITCSYGILGRIFGYGNLIIESAGTKGKLTFEGIPHPKRIKSEIENATYSNQSFHR